MKNSRSALITSKLRYALDTPQIYLEFKSYEDNRRMAVIAYDLHGHRVATFSTNMPQLECEPGHFWLKDYGENEGAYETLMESGMFEDTGQRKATGFVEVIYMRLLKGGSGCCGLCQHFAGWGVASDEQRPEWGKDGVCQARTPSSGDKNGAADLCVLKNHRCEKFERI